MNALSQSSSGCTFCAQQRKRQHSFSRLFLLEVLTFCLNFTSSIVTFLPLLYFILISQFPISVLFFFLMSYALPLENKEITLCTLPSLHTLRNGCSVTSHQHILKEVMWLVPDTVRSYKVVHISEVCTVCIYSLYHTSWNLSLAFRGSGVI